MGVVVTRAAVLNMADRSRAILLPEPSNMEGNSAAIMWGLEGYPARSTEEVQHLEPPGLILQSSRQVFAFTGP